MKILFRDTEWKILHQNTVNRERESGEHRANESMEVCGDLCQLPDERSTGHHIDSSDI